MEAYETIDAGDGWTIHLHYDEGGYNADPTEWEGSPRYALAHNRYRLRDDYGIGNTENYEGWHEIEAEIIENERPVAILPVYMMDHSGVALSTGEYGCRWDSGQVGYVYVTPEQVKEWGTPADHDWTADLAANVDQYGRWLNGEVYGYVVTGPNGDHADSCWGFLDPAYMAGEARAAVEWGKADPAQRQADANADGIAGYLSTLGLA